MTALKKKIPPHNFRLGLLFLFGLCLVAIHCSHNSVTHLRKSESDSNVPSIASKLVSSPQPKINIFYNLFIQKQEDVERVKGIIAEQLSHLLPEEHNEVFITSLGYPEYNIPKATIIQHYAEGDEDLSLHALWEYCKINPHHDTKVIYLHSKGSFRDTPDNSKLRSFITRSALSKECANLPDQCDVCSSRMSPLPHVHTSGNMWLARCDHVAKLPDPSFKREGKLEEFNAWGRYFNEHWIHMHPSMQACDLYPGREFVWSYDNIPEGDFEIDLQMAPRFEYEAFIPPFPNQNIPKPAEVFLQKMMHEFDLFYDRRPDESWWGWEFYRHPYNTDEK